jgi:predicted nucleotidyltransferase
MTENNILDNTDNKYQNQDTSNETRIDDMELLKKKAAEQAAKMQEQKKQIAEQIKKLMGDTVKKAIPFKKEVVGKFKQQLLGMLVMPPKADKKLETKTGKINDNLDILTIIELRDISDLKKKIEKKQDIEKKIREIAKKKMKDHQINVVLLDEIWDMCLKGKHDILNILTMGQPLYDSGWVGAIRMTEIHKMKVLQKFEKYVICYVLGGSMARGQTHELSDVDTYIIIDDTDVTRMTSAELRQRLMGIIWGYAQEAALAAGVKNVLNVQVYVLSDMWDSIKNANPVIVTFLRDGIPLYDRGMFTPWKMLLKKGKIKPTPEAITNYMKSGDQFIKRIEGKLKEIAIEDFYWIGTTPMQGALMLLGHQPPPPKELGAAIREHLVKKGLIEEKYAKIWDSIFKIHKDIEHGKIKVVDAKDIAKLLTDARDYLKRIDKLFKEIEKDKICEEMTDLYNKTVEDCLAAIAMIGESATKKNAFSKFKDYLVDKQLASERYYLLIRKIEELNKSRSATTREEIASLNFEQDKLSSDLFNIIRAEQGQKIEKFKITAIYNNGKHSAAIWLFTKEAYIILDIKSADTEIMKYTIGSDGTFKDEKSAKLSEIEKKIQTFSGTPTTMTKKTIESLKNLLSDDVKIVIGA